MVTLKDIAKEANVSIATVSRYLNHKITLKPETEDAINEAIKKLHYVPNVVAQSLKFNRTSNVAVILPKVNTLYYSDMTSGISSVLSRCGFNLFIFEVDHLNKTEEAILQTLRENMIAGAVFIGMSYDDRFYRSLDILRSSGIPVVFTNRQIPFEETPLVYPDFYRCGEIAARHLLQRGCRKPGLVHALSDSELLSRHIASFSGPLKEAGLEAPEVFFSAQGIRPPESCLTAVEKSGCDGLFVLNELIAAGLIRALQIRGVRVPEDIAVIAFGNSLAGELTKPAMTCIDLQNYELGVKSAETIVSQIFEEEFEPVSVLAPELVIREST